MDREVGVRCESFDKTIAKAGMRKKYSEVTTTEKPKKLVTRRESQPENKATIKILLAFPELIRIGRINPNIRLKVFGRIRISFG